MPFSPELRIFLDIQKSRLAIEDQEIAKIPRLDFFPVETTIDSLHNGETWCVIDHILADASLNLPERKIVHSVLAGISNLEYPAGTFHHPTIKNIIEMTDQDLLLLSYAGAMIDVHSVAVLRKLFGRKEEAEG